MICTSEVPCLPNGLARNSKVMSMFVPFSRLFSHFKVWLFFKNEGTNLTQKQPNSMFIKFLKGTTIK